MQPVTAQSWLILQFLLAVLYMASVLPLWWFYFWFLIYLYNSDFNEDDNEASAKDVIEIYF